MKIKIWNEKLVFDTCSFAYGRKSTWPVMLVTVMDKDYDSNEFRQVKDLDFDRFTLGNIEGIVVEMPGHTRGSVGVYLPELKLLLCGDALTPIMCLFFMNHGIYYCSSGKSKDN